MSWISSGRFLGCVFFSSQPWNAVSALGYNTPELLSEFVIVAAVNSCIYAQMLSRLAGEMIEGSASYWKYMARAVLKKPRYLNKPFLVLDP